MASEVKVTASHSVAYLSGLTLNIILVFLTVRTTQCFLVEEKLLTNHVSDKSGVAASVNGCKKYILQDVRERKEETLQFYYSM